MPSEVKTLIDEYANENALLRAMLQEREIALAMVTAHYGKPAKTGGPVVVVPAAARKRAQTLVSVDLRWANNDWSKGGLRIVTTLTAKDT